MNTQQGMNQQQGKRRGPAQQEQGGTADGPRDAGERPRHEQVELAAYFLAEQRGFEPGHEVEDWVAAETDVARTRTAGQPSAG